MAFPIHVLVSHHHRVIKIQQILQITCSFLQGIGKVIEAQIYRSEKEKNKQSQRQQLKYCYIGSSVESLYRAVDISARNFDALYIITIKFLKSPACNFQTFQSGIGF